MTSNYEEKIFSKKIKLFEIISADYQIDHSVYFLLHNTLRQSYRKDNDSNT